MAWGGERRTTVMVWTFLSAGWKRVGGHLENINRTMQVASRCWVQFRVAFSASVFCVSNLEG